MDTVNGDSCSSLHKSLLVWVGAPIYWNLIALSERRKLTRTKIYNQQYLICVFLTTVVLGDFVHFGENFILVAIFVLVADIKILVYVKLSLVIYW